MTGYAGTHYPASSLPGDRERGVPAYAKLGPAPCSTCGAFVWYAHSQTRHNGATVKGFLCWRELGGRIHECPKP